jgi:hypothetical protein
MATDYQVRLYKQSLRFYDDADEAGTFVVKHKIDTGTADTFRFEKAAGELGTIQADVVSASGNATVGGTLGVTGASTLDSLGVTNNATVGGTLGVTGASTLDSLGVTNNATVGGTLGVTGASTLDSLGVTNNATVGGTLGVTGASTLGSVTASGAVQFNGGATVPTGQTLTITDAPASNSHAANKAYVDTQIASVAQGLDSKYACQVATTANIADLSSPGASIDGVTLADGMRVLVKDQTDQTENGIYVVDSGQLVRADDMDANTEVKGAYTLVQEGTSEGYGYVVIAPNADDNVAIGTDNIVWSPFQSTGGGSVTAGNGLTASGSELNVVAGDGLTAGADILDLDLDGASLSKSGDGLRVAAGGVANAMLENSSITINGTATALGGSYTADSLSVAADSGLSMTAYNGNGAVSDLAISVDNLDELLAAPANNDHLCFADADDSSTTKKVTVARLADSVLANVSGDAQVASGGELTIQDDAVSTAKIADDAVTTAKIDDAAVTEAKLAADAVATAKIADSAVTAAKLADDAVQTAKIADDAVTAAKLAGDCAGTGLAQNGTDGSLEIDIHELTDLNAQPAHQDTFAMVDADDSNTSKRVSFANMATKLAGTGLSATDGVLAIDSVTSAMIANDTIVNADIASGADIAISKLAASTISGVDLGQNLNDLSVANTSGLSMSNYNGSSAVSDLAVVFDTSGGDNSASLEMNGTNGLRINPLADVKVHDLTMDSDAAKKHDIEALLNGLEVLRQLKPSTWLWNADDSPGAGVIAQEIRDVLPWVVKTGDDGALTVRYMSLIGYIISAIQKLDVAVNGPASPESSESSESSDIPASSTSGGSAATDSP